MKLQECTHTIASKQTINLRLFTDDDGTIGGAGCLANFQVNLTMALLYYFFELPCIC